MQDLDVKWILHLAKFRQGARAPENYIEIDYFKTYRVVWQSFAKIGPGTSKNRWTEKNKNKNKLECGPMPNVMVALPNIGGALRSMPQSLTDAHYLTAVQ